MRVRSSRLPRFARNEFVMVPLGALAFALVFSWPVLGHLTTPGAMGDWDMLMGIKWASYETIVKFHQLPLWDPYKCGGLPMLGNPQSQIISPFFPLTLLYGPFLGTHLQMILSLGLAWSGGYVLARVIGISLLGAVAAATVFPASSWFYLTHARDRSCLGAGGNLRAMGLCRRVGRLGTSCVSLRGSRWCGIRTDVPRKRTRWAGIQRGRTCGSDARIGDGAQGLVAALDAGCARTVRCGPCGNQTSGL
jgi:hypothetical protein